MLGDNIRPFEVLSFEIREFYLVKWEWYDNHTRGKGIIIMKIFH